MTLKNSSKVKEIRPYSMKELCKIYGVSPKTLRKWLKKYEAEIGERQGNIYNVTQVTVIFQKLGIPSIIKEN